MGGLTFAEAPLSAISRFNWSPESTKARRLSERLVKMTPRSAQIWSSQPLKNRKPRYDKINPDPYAYAKRTAGRVAATPALRSLPVGPASRTPQAAACRLLEYFLLAVGALSRRHRWSTIPPRLWENPSAAHLKSFTKSIACFTKSTPTPSFGNRFTTTCGFNIPNGFNQMANPPCVILTRGASWNCSPLCRQGDPTSLSLPSNRD